MQHASLMAQMAAIVDDANRTGRELRGDELLEHDRLSAQAAKALSDLQTIDPLAAKVARSNISTQRPASSLLVDNNETRSASRIQTSIREDRAHSGGRPRGINEMMQQIQSSIREDRNRKPPVKP
jgi:hypothetical protein